MIMMRGVYYPRAALMQAPARPNFLPIAVAIRPDVDNFPAPIIMAKKSWIERNKRRERTVKKYAPLRKQLKEEKDYTGLSMLPRDASPTRVVNRCEVTGRRRAFIRRFKMSRITFRELASQGMIPGVTKSSW